MSFAGFCVMSVSLTFVVLLNIFCFSRVLRPRPPHERSGVPPDEHSARERD